MTISPWHQTLWRSLQQRSQVIPSSTLLVGRPGTDVLNLGMELAGLLLCNAEISDRPCTTCSSCHMFKQGVHPDLHVVATEEAERLDEIRRRRYHKKRTKDDS